MRNLILLIAILFSGFVSAQTFHFGCGASGYWVSYDDNSPAIQLTVYYNGGETGDNLCISKEYALKIDPDRVYTAQNPASGTNNISDYMNHAVECDYTEYNEEDPEYYVNMFIEEAKGYGYDFSDQYYRLQHIIVNGVLAYSPVPSRIEIESDYGGGSNAFTIGRCKQGYYIGINPNSWYGTTTLWKKYLIYHELGHDMLNLSHVCNRSDSNPNIFNVEPDIMWAYNVCEIPDGLGYAYDPAPAFLSETVLNEQIDRMFNLIGQNQSICASTGKGHDNEEVIHD